MEETITFARRIMDANGLQKWKVKANKATVTFGSCRFKDNTLVFSKILIPYCSSKAKKTIVIHEIAHAIVGAKHGHDEIWRQKDIELGGNGKRMGDDNYFEDASYSIIQQKHYKYKAVCANGHTHYRNRKPALVVSCKECSPVFNRKFILSYKENVQETQK